MTDTGGDLIASTDTNAVYSGSAIDENKQFFVTEFTYKRIDSDSSFASFLVLLDGSGSQVKNNNPVQLTDGDLSRDNFMLQTATNTYLDTGFLAQPNTEYGVQFLFNVISAGTLTLNIDTNLDSVYENGVSSPFNPVSQRGFTPRFDAFGTGAVIEISDLEIYAYPDEDTYLAIHYA
tara:strand:+ start:311 stop:841 length:531 start_codon:yes stop_codon:yes gene_type:complete